MHIVIDTNALIRFFTNDIPQKANLLEKLLKEKKHIFVPDVVFPELEYIFVYQYKFPRKKLLKIFTFLVSQSNIDTTYQAKTAIFIFEKSKLDMADSIIAAYSLKGKLASFDKKLLQVEGASPFWK